MKELWIELYDQAIDEGLSVLAAVAAAEQGCIDSFAAAEYAAEGDR